MLEMAFGALILFIGIMVGASLMRIRDSMEEKEDE